MKNSYALLFILLISASSLQATIWRVNNQSTSTAVFTTVQAAIDSDLVSNGDTILIEGSAQTYAGFDVDKRLVIIGSGYFLNENPKTSLDGIHSIIQGDANFNTGSEGSVLSSVIFGSLNSGYGPDIATNDITITNCFLQNEIEIAGNVSGLWIIKNYFNTQFIEYFNSSYKMQGLVLKNNIITNDAILSSTVQTPRTFAAVENNLFLGSVNLTTSTYRNNIWLPLESETISVTAGIKEYNLNISVDMGAENNNQVFTGTTQLYTGAGSTDGKWQIKEDSAFKNAGKDGTDPGPFGGANPYVLSGLPALPVIYEISTTGFGSTEDGLPVTIKVRAN